MIDVDTARSRYAEWFVKRHYLKKQQPWTPGGGLYGGPDWPSRWRYAERQGFIRYYYQWEEPITLSDGEVLREGRDEVHDELSDSLHYGLWGKETEPEKRWFRVELKDLDDPIHDENKMVQNYRRYRTAAAEMNLWEWLMAECEYHVVTFEAWLRAYGTDPSQFPVEAVS